MRKLFSLSFLLVLVLFSLQCSSSGSSSNNTTTTIEATETDFDEASTIAMNADTQLDAYKQTAATIDDAKQQLVDWLLTQDGVTDAGVDEEDSKTVWFYHSSGLTSGILTENSFTNGSSAPLPVTDFDFSDRPSVQGLTPAVSRASSTVGMMAWLLSPFYTENISDDKIFEIADIYKEPLTNLNFYTPILDENANIGAFQAALVGFLPPAAHLTVISHGSRIRLSSTGQRVSVVVSGEYQTPSTWSVYGSDFLAGRLITIAYKGKLWLSMTPAFFEYYSGTPDPGDSHWMARYVHLLTCFGYKDNTLRDAFMNHGAQSFSGFTCPVDAEWGNTITLQYFQNLAEGEGRTVDEAISALGGTVNPAEPNCSLRHSTRSTDTRYFYRASVVADGVTYLTPAYAWTAVFNNNPGYYFSNSVFNATTGANGGILTIKFDSTSGGDVATEGSITELMYTDAFGTTWFNDHSQWVDKSIPGTVTVTTFDDRNGGQVIGSFSGTLVDSVSAPNFKQITGNFELIKSGGSDSGGGGGNGFSTVYAIPCPTSNTTNVTIADFQFIPADLQISANTIVKWTNSGPSTHTVTSTVTPTDGSFDSGNLSVGDEVCLMFTQAGTYDYNCSLHPAQMTGTVTVQ